MLEITSSQFPAVWATTTVYSEIIDVQSKLADLPKTSLILGKFATS